MAITLALANLIIDKTAIARCYPGGVLAFLRAKHGPVFGQDEDLIALGFMQTEYGDDLREKLIALGMPRAWMVLTASNMDSDDDLFWLRWGDFEMVSEDAAIQTEHRDYRTPLFLAWKADSFPTVAQLNHGALADKELGAPRYVRLLPGSIELIDGNIAEKSADIIVNSTNVSLRSAGGIDGAIHRAAGPGLRDECNALRSCDPGNVVVTQAQDLKARYIIHAVGPRLGAEKLRESDLLLSCYRRSFEHVTLLGARSICFPPISTGVNGFPGRDAARIAVAAAREFLAQTGLPVRISFCCHSQRDYDHYQSVLREQPSPAAA
jgi:O-acetyl-ADP-ribose deacetylase (regulator of RNase III)